MTCVEENKIKKNVKNVEKKEKNTLWYRPGGKVLLFCGAILSFILCAASIVGWVFLLESGAYRDQGKQLKQWAIENYIKGKQSDVVNYYDYMTKKKPTNLMDQHYEDIFSPQKVNYCFSVMGKESKKGYSNERSGPFQYESEVKYEVYLEDKEYNKAKE